MSPERFRPLRLAPLAAIAAFVLSAAACQRLSAASGIVHPLDPASQQIAAQMVAGAFAGPCLAIRDPRSSTGALQALGWRSFGVVWDQPDSTFYAAKPSPTAPAGLFVISDRQASPVPIADLQCVGHYAADDPAPMVQAIERRWGPSRDGPPRLPASRAWAFRYSGGALTPAPIAEGAGGPATAAALAGLGEGEALVYAQVSYNAPTHDIASLVSVRRRP